MEFKKSRCFIYLKNSDVLSITNKRKQKVVQKVMIVIAKIMPVPFCHRIQIATWIPAYRIQHTPNYLWWF